MTTCKLADVLQEAAIGVLETMFFAEASSAGEDTATHSDAVACLLESTGFETGEFTIAIDREALQILCCAFYGDEDDPSSTQQQEMICELTNMIAGSTLSSYAPTHYCKLSSPTVCDMDRHLQTAIKYPQDHVATINLSIEGGLLSASCSLRTKP